MACAIVFIVPFFPDEQLIRLKMQVLELGVFAFALVVGLRILFCGRTNSSTTQGNYIFGSVLIWMIVNAGLWYFSKEKSLATPELRRILLAGVAFIAFYMSELSERWRRYFLLSWSAAASLLAIYGLLQVTGGVGSIMVPQMPRIMGTYGNPIFFAAFLEVSLFVSLMAFSQSSSNRKKILLGLGFLLQLAAIYFTQTRAAWLAVLLALVLGGISKYGIRRVPLIGWALLVIVLGIFSFQTKKVWNRDQGHLLIWRDTLRMWKDHPVTGVGLGAFHTNFPTYAQEDLKAKWPTGGFIVNDAHNEYLQTLAESGIVGFIAFLIIPVLFFLSRRPWDWLCYGVLAIFIQNFFSVDMRFGVSLAMAFILMGFDSPTSLSAEADPKWVRDRIKSRQRPLPWVLAVIWICFLMLFILPRLLRPYRAQKEVAAAPSFFDQRLLDPAKSISDFERIAREYPTEPAVIERLAFVYAKEMKTVDGKINPEMTDKAVRAYAKLIELDTTRLGAYNNLANILYTTGRVEEAIATWQRALVVDPDFIDIRLNLGKILYVRGQLKESAAHFEQVLKLDPNNSEAIVYLKRMVE